MRLRARHAVFAALALGPSAQADGDPPPLWRVCPSESRLGFEVAVNDRPVAGTLPAFRGEGRFAPARPGDTAFTLVIDMTRLDVGPAVADHFARSPDWFDTQTHPTARFRLEEMRPAPGDDVWRATGALTLLGVERDVTAALRLDLGEATARAWGETGVDRRDFGVGKGVSAAIVSVGRDVRVTFDLRARSGDAGHACPSLEDAEQ